MKKIILSALLVLTTGVFAFAQKYAYVDTQYILSKIPEYTSAQDELDNISVQWQKEIEEKFSAIDKMYKAYQAESVLLPDDMKKKKEDDIVAKEKEAKELQKKRFGKDGDLFKKRQELVKPIQDKVYNAIEEIATAKSYAFVFDKAGSLTILFADPKYDLSEDVIKKVGGITDK